MPEISGVIPATVTPFTRGGGEVDIEWIAKHLDFLREKGIRTVLPLGTTGEGPSLSLEERKQVINTVMAARGGLSVIFGTGCSALSDTVELSRYALEKGADAILVVPPFYFKSLDSQGTRNYYRSVLKALPPEGKVILYHIPAFSGVPISDELLDSILEEFPSQLWGIKDTSGQLRQTRHYVYRYPSLRTFGGSDHLIGDSLKAGAAGVISALANVFPQEVAGIYLAFREGSPWESTQERVNRLRDLLRKYSPQGTLKFLLHHLRGLPKSYVRPPLTDLTPLEEEKLDEEVKGLL